jgi:hypothetical protein
VETSKCRIQPHSDSGPQQLSLPSLQPNARALVIKLEVEAMFIGDDQVVFERFQKHQ